MSNRSLIDPDRYAGTITCVTAAQAHVNLPYATASAETRRAVRGVVGDFVVVDVGLTGVLGRITEVRLPEGERLAVEPRLGGAPISHPVGRVQLLASIDQCDRRLQRGIRDYPRVGDGVYLVDPTLLAELIDMAAAKAGEIALRIGTMDAAKGVDVRLPPEKLFGRHCGVFGSTGGGKSWTIAALVQQVRLAGGKAIILDPTGEFATMAGIGKLYSFEDSEDFDRVHFPYRRLTEDDLFSLFRPSGQSQGPKLRDAIKSLKLVEALNGAQIRGLHCDGSLIIKANQQRAPFFSTLKSYAESVHVPHCNFDISQLPEQIKNECVWATSKNYPGNFGDVEGNSQAHCETLVSRISTLINSKELECLFKTEGASLVEELDAFFEDEAIDIALVSFKDVRFEHGTREILLNIIGRHLLSLAREGRFRDRPIVVFLDEAHQFLGKSIGDDYGSVRLDAFGLIAKEGRKYGLTCVMATQRPRDIPPDVISQLGTLIVHRLTNEQDRETVERACGDLDRSAAQFIPMLAPGEAVLIGPDLPVSVPLKISAPASPPDSRGPTYQRYWKGRKADLERAVRKAAAEPVHFGVEAGLELEAHDPVPDDDIPF